jgi:hypothetical protein
MRRLATLGADVRSMGALGWSIYAADRLLDRLTGGRARLWAFRFYAQPVPDEPLLPPARGVSKMVVGVIEASDVAPELFERPKGAIEERFEDGSLCIAARDGQRLAGFMWLRFGVLRERLLACDFEPLPAGLTCWDYDFEVLPRYRLGRTFARLWDEGFRLLRARGVRESVSWIAFSNLASQRAHERMGARRVGWLVVLDAFGYKLAAQSGGPRLRGRPRLRFAGRSERLHVPVDTRNDSAHSVAKNQTPVSGPDPDRG